MRGYGVFAQFYDRLTENVDYRRRAVYFDRLVRRFAPQWAGGLLLDLACGTGSLSLELAGLGYEVIGADGSVEMLSVAMGKEVPEEQSVLFIRQDMESLDLYGTVDVTVCALDSLNHLSGEEALERCVKGVSLFTRPGGLFLFDVNTPYKHREILAHNTFVLEPEGLCCIWRNDWSPQGDQVDIRLDFFVEESDGSYSRWEEEFSERIFSHETLVEVLHRCGMELLACYGEDSLGDPKEDDQRLVYVAKKKE